MGIAVVCESTGINVDLDSEAGYCEPLKTQFFRKCKNSGLCDCTHRSYNVISLFVPTKIKKEFTQKGENHRQSLYYYFASIRGKHIYSDNPQCSAGRSKRPPFIFMLLLHPELQPMCSSENSLHKRNILFFLKNNVITSTPNCPSNSSSPHKNPT